MAAIRQCIHAEIDLSRDPVQELSTVIAAVLQVYKGQERQILVKLQEAVEGHIKVIDKEADKRGKTVSETGRG